LADRSRPPVRRRAECKRRIAADCRADGNHPFNDAVTTTSACTGIAGPTHGHLEREVRGAGLRIVQSGGVFFKPLANFQFDKLMAATW